MKKKISLLCIWLPFTCNGMIVMNEEGHVTVIFNIFIEIDLSRLLSMKPQPH